MEPFKIGDYVRRLERDYCGQGLSKGSVYVVVSCYDAGGKGSPKDYRVRLVDQHGQWDAHRFELAQPNYVQACPCGIHWSECSIHKDGSK